MKIENVFGYMKIEKQYAALLRLCKAKHVSKWAIDCIKVYQNSLVATDGRQMIVIFCKHLLAPGLSYLTTDDLILPTNEKDKKFPPWKDVVNNNVKQIKLIDYAYDDKQALYEIVYRINTSGVRINLNRIENFLRALTKLEPTDMILEVVKENPEKHAIQIRCQIRDGKILFLLMPPSL